MASEQNHHTVGDYVTLQRGTTYKGSLVGEPGPALLGLGSIQPGGGFRHGHYKTYGGDCPAKLMLSPGELYVALKGATKDGEMIGSIARLPSTVSSGRLTQDTVKLVFRNANDNATYLYWILRTPQYRSYCRGHAMGSAVVALSRRDFLAFPVPPLTSWRKQAVALLDTLESKIESNRRAMSLLERLADLNFKIAANKEVTLGSVAHLTMGSSPPGESYNEDSRGIPFYQGVRDFGFRSPSWRVWTTAPVRFASANDTLFSVRAPVGRLNRASERCCIGRGVAAIASDWPSTAYYSLRAAESAWQAFHSEGTVFGAINRTDLSKARIPWPADVYLTSILEKLLSSIDARIDSLLREVDRLEALRDALLPELLSARIRVPGAPAAKDATV